MELEAANLMAFKAAALYDEGRDCGAEANMAKLLAADASWAAADMFDPDFIVDCGSYLYGGPFFVRCDRTTMTQDDIDNGRLIVLIGIAPIKPAEFVIFRIGQ